MGLTQTDVGVELTVLVVPGANHDAVVGWHGTNLKIRIQAPPVDGAANKRLVRFLSRRVLGLPRSAVQLIRGERAREKTILVDAPLASVLDALSAWGTAPPE
ncbi:MAG: DUF167 domain-containing protein [Myxococcota bacterium]|nr:DUF167 domain-containing protein [Myxococcota bacterium]